MLGDLANILLDTITTSVKTAFSGIVNGIVISTVNVTKEQIYPRLKDKLDKEIKRLNEEVS